MIRTAIPFGYLFIALFLGLAFFTGLGLVILEWRKKRSIARIVGSFMMIGVVALVVIEILFESYMEWNPSISDDSRILGTWADNRKTITLRADHSVDYKSDPGNVSGKWTRVDDNLYLFAEGVNSRMRFITFKGELRLMTNPPEDPDMWDGDLGLRCR